MAFLVTAGILHAALGDTLRLHADIRSEKLEMMKEWHGKVFSAVFGSSRVHDGFDPRAFDLALAGTPLATRSANFAVEGGSQSEQRVMALRFLQQLESPASAGAPAQPCLAILEFGAGANFANRHLMHPRSINIYDWQTTRLVTHFVSPGMPFQQRVGRIGFALIAETLHYANVGMLSNAIFAPPLNQEILSFQTADDRRGMDPLPDNPKFVETYQRRLANRPAVLPIRQGVVSPGNYDLIDELAANSPVSHVSFVYVVMPITDDLWGAEDLPEHLTVHTEHGTIDVPIVNLARPDRFPQLYDPSLWWDPDHVNERGASLATQILAEQLKKWYGAHGMPHPCGG
jgi:hypothetical protein